MINNYIKNTKFNMSNRLKFIKLLVFVFVLCLINISYSNAACDFDGLGIGEKSSDAEGTFGEAITENNIGVIIVIPEEACPGENLEDVSVQIIISGDEIAGFRFELDSLELDNQDNEQFLYQYVVRNYGPIEGSERKNWTGHKIWQIFDQEVLYRKSFFLKRLEEELIVTNSKHRDAFVDYDPDLDEPEEEQ
ncbi:uncharacterized protein METZ01_LOCUS330562 [marine metagenome]|uniref:Uncharacterized protein n=1 Tax=marine metagenome TaxID=408172 RepID=A0A382PYK1_9ZZZZ